jgi:hypothetical protein
MLRPPSNRPPSRRAAEQRDEIAPFYLIGLHSVPVSQGRIAALSNWRRSVSGYRGHFATGRGPMSESGQKAKNSH